jgi:hypothetical protein
MKKINSERVKQIRKSKGSKFWKDGHPKGSSNGTSLKGKTYDEIYGAERSELQRKKLSNSNKGKNPWNNFSEEKKLC